MGERFNIDYKRNRTYIATANNVVGATTSTTLRTVPTPSGDIAYVRKFGVIFSTAGATTLADFATTTGAGESLLYTLTSADGGTSFGNITDINGAVTDNTSGTIGATDGLKIVLSCSAGAGVSNEISFSINGVTIVLPDEAISNGDSITFYISNTGSSYYDSELMYGGARHTPALNDEDLPYFHPYDALSACADANDDGAEILDSETYSFPYYSGGWVNELDMNLSQFSLYSTAGQTPTIMSVVGASAYREVTAQHNNTDTLFVSKTGNDANAGTYQEPFLTHSAAFAALAGETYIVTMDSESYNEDIDINAAVIFEPLYGKTPIFTYSSAISHILDIQVATCDIYGLTFDGDNICQKGLQFNTYNIAYDNIIRNCTIYNFTPYGVYIRPRADGGNPNFDGDVSYNLIHSNVYNIYMYLVSIELGALAPACTVNRNILYNATYGIQVSWSDANANATMDFTNNIAYNNSSHGFYWTNGNSTGCDFSNCTYYNNGRGFEWASGNASGTFDGIIGWGNTEYDFIENSGGANLTITNCHYYTQYDVIIGAGTEQQDPYFSSETNIRLGLQPDIAATTAIRSDTNSDDRGAHFRVIEINESTIEINGIIFEGNSQYNNAIYILDTADHTDLTLRWCTLQNFQGVSTDLYDDDTNLDATINNCWFQDNGSDIALYYGGCTVDECILIRGSVYGLWSDYTGQSITHNTFYNAQYNTYFESNTASIIYKNNITNGASLYGIYSEVSVSPTYSDITDAVNSSVDITATSNITENPLFVDVTLGSENFNLKSTYTGYLVGSPCIGISDTSTNLGAYDVTYTQTTDDWKQYTVEHNPRTMNEALKSKGYVKWEDIKGNIGNFADSQRIIIPMKWPANHGMSKTLMQKLRYFSTLIPSYENGLTDEECEFRIHLLPSKFYGTGTGTIDATAKTITDSSAAYIENEKKGWWVSVKYTSGSGTGAIDSGAKTLTVAPDPSWTNDEWIGYYMFYDGYYYYITDNDSDTLTLSDGNSYLTDVASITWSITKSFKIESNTETVLTVTDDDSNLVSGSYDYFIDFILSKISKSSFSWSQLIGDYEKDYWKSNIGIEWEEID